MERLGFSDGIYVHSTVYRPDGPEASSEFVVPPVELTLSDDEKTVFNQASEEILTTYTSPVRGGTASRDLQYVIANDNDDTTTTGIFFPGWGGSSQTASGRLEIARLAAKNPTTRWVVPTTPGMDGSDRLPASIRHELHRTGSFISAGEFILQGLRPALADDEPLDIFAFSQGDNFAAGLAVAAETNHIHDLKVIDPVGLQKRSWLEMFHASVIKAGANAKSYWAASSVDPESILVRHSKISVNESSRRRTVYERLGAFVDTRFRYPRAVGRAAFLADLQLALANISGEVTVMIPDKSEFNSLPNVSTKLASLAIKSAAKIRMDNFNGTHAFLAGHPNVLARFAGSLTQA